ncbi:uncharacterized protein [Onthophagus taurus]|uniref:uncharacterized protein n=1 Tax=Onthophagus taurus TaxID=166361 RepID=UPI000C202FF1|nr:uncharacterized protein LOC111428039 [Onthophagus taurus]
MSQPTKVNQVTKDIKVIDLIVEQRGQFDEDEKFEKVRENIQKSKEPNEKDGQDVNETTQVATKSNNTEEATTLGSPNEAIFFNDDIYEIVADFKAIPRDEIYCRVSEGCVEVGAIHKETQGVGPKARHLDLQLTRLYQTPRAININDSFCYLSGDGILFITGSYKEQMMSQQK